MKKLIVLLIILIGGIIYISQSDLKPEVKEVNKEIKPTVENNVPK